MKRILTLAALLFLQAAKAAEPPNFTFGLGLSAVPNGYTQGHVSSNGFAVAQAISLSLYPTWHRVVWITLYGRTLIDANVTLSDLKFVRILNSRQLLVCHLAGYTLFTVTEPGKWSINEYPGHTHEGYTHLWLLDPEPVHGFYRPNSITGAAERVDFPEVPHEVYEVGLTLESAPDVSGEWTPVTAVTVPVGSTNAIYRLRITR